MSGVQLIPAPKLPKNFGMLRQVPPPKRAAGSGKHESTDGRRSSRTNNIPSLFCVPFTPALEGNNWTEGRDGVCGWLAAS